MRWSVLFLLATLSYGQDMGFGEIITRQLARNAKYGVATPAAVAQIPFSVPLADYQGEATFMIGLQDQQTAISVRLPDGSSVTQANAAGKGARWEAQSGPAGRELFSCPGATRWIVITLPQSKRLADYVVVATSTARSNVCATFLGDPLGQEGKDYVVVGSSVTTDHKQYQVGDTVVISVPVKSAGGAPVRGAQVEAVVQVQDNVRITDELGRLRLTDPDGDGIYSGSYRATKATMTAVTVTISGRQQAETGNFFVNPAHARLVSVALMRTARSAYAEVKFQVATAGTYKISPELSVRGRIVNNTVIIKKLAPGEHTITGESIAPVPGGLKLTGIHVVMENPAATYGVDLVGHWVVSGPTLALE
jgi:hypothetical protein